MLWAYTLTVCFCTFVCVVAAVAAPIPVRMAPTEISTELVPLVLQTEWSANVTTVDMVRSSHLAPELPQSDCGNAFPAEVFR